MQKLHLWTLLPLFACGIVAAQTSPVIGTPPDDTIFVQSGENFLLIPGVDDGDEGADQEIAFTVTSSDTTILQVEGVSHTPGQTFAVIRVAEKGVSGSVTLQVEASDGDGMASVSFEVAVSAYQNNGIYFEIHDIIFWQEVVPLRSNPSFTMIAPSGLAPYSQIDLPSLDLSVYNECTSGTCTGVDFFTALFKGYLIPPVSGEYTFYMRANDRLSMGISTDENFDNARVIIYRSPDDSKPSIGTPVGNKEYRSAPVSLEAGKVYAIYGTHWNIHTLLGGMSWEGPGIEKEYIPGEYLSYVYDVEKPTTPEDLTLVNTGINDFRIRWSESADDGEVAGYRVYLNGSPWQASLIHDTELMLGGLEPGTRYCVTVTSLDMAGNESLESGIICTTTYESDSNPPLPPVSLEAAVVSDLYLQVAWNGATDGETEVRGYHIYVDGIRYNSSELVFDEELLISGLTPETGYRITVESVDAGLNVSPMSDTLEVSTTRFDPDDTLLSDKKARLTVHFETIGRSEGLGVNPNYKSGEFLNDPQQANLIRELEAAGVRWGALTANPLNFKDYIGSGKPMTFGRFMDFCNEIGAYTIITCGVENSTDWRTEPATFLHFLEYLAGPADSQYGAKRAAEGYAEPLLQQSRGLILEFGNEVWGASSHNAQIGSDYAGYGAWCREVAGLMRSSEYYDPEKIALAYSGRRPVPNDSYGLHESLLQGDTGEVDWLAVSGYLGGNLSYSPEIDPGRSELDYYKNGLAEMNRNLKGLEATMDLILQASGDFKPTYMYESNMTTPSYYGRLGQAIVQTDYYASVVERGGVIPTIFHLTGGQWAMTVPPQNYKKLPLFYTAKYYNRFCKGNALRTELQTSAARPVSGLDPVGSHVYADEDGFSVLMFSRDFEHDYTVQVDIPDELSLTAPEQGMYYVISGEDFSTRETVIDSMQVTMSDSLLVEVPKHSMVILRFGGDTSPVEEVEMGYYNYVSASSVTIYAYNTEVFDISGNEKKILLTEVAPEEALSDAVKWSVDTNGVEVEYGLKPWGFEVKGSGNCAGNGTITVRAEAWDNPEVFDEVTITLSNQGSNCEVSVEDQDDSGIRIFPNPAGTTLQVQGIPPGFRRISVTDLWGRECLSRQKAGASLSLDISGLEKGIYFLKISDSDRSHIRSFVKN